MNKQKDIMSTFTNKNSVLWLISILLISITAGGIGNYITEKNIIGGIIIVVLFIFIPFLIELLRKNDPIVYYGLNLETLKTISMKTVFAYAIGIFSIISLVDYLFFDLLNIILNTKAGISVGSTSVALAKSDYFYLGIIVVFSGTLMEELWFRGVIQLKISHIKSLKPINPHFAIMIQSILFGLIHFIPVYYGTDFSIMLKLWFFIYPAIIGVVIGYLNDKYQSLWPGWIIHYTNNLFNIFLLAVLFRI